MFCGFISQYNITSPEEKYGLKNVEQILFKSIRVEGFTSAQYYGTDIEKEFEKDMAEWIMTGKIIYKPNISVGIESYIDMLNCKNAGKALVKLSVY